MHVKPTKKLNVTKTMHVKPTKKLNVTQTMHVKPTKKILIFLSLIGLLRFLIKN